MPLSQPLSQPIVGNRCRRLGVLRVGTVHDVDRDHRCRNRTRCRSPFRRTTMLGAVGTSSGRLLNKEFSLVVVAHLQPATGIEYRSNTRRTATIDRPGSSRRSADRRRHDPSPHPHAESQPPSRSNRESQPVACVTAWCRSRSQRFRIHKPARHSRRRLRSAKPVQSCRLVAGGHAARVGRAGNRSQHGNLAKLHRFKFSRIPFSGF